MADPKPEWVLDVEHGRGDWGDDPQETVRFFQSEIERGEWVSAALVGLGAHLSRELDDDAGAVDCFRRAVELGEPEWVADALVSMGYVLERADDLDGAEAAFRQATETERAPQAFAALGTIAWKRGDPDRAAAWYRKAIDEGNPRWYRQALFDLARLLRGEGDLDGAAAAYVRLSEEEGWVDVGLVGLGRIHAERGDPAAAEAAYRRVIEAPETPLRFQALVALRALLIAEGRGDEAWTLYLQVVEDDREDWAPMTFDLLGGMLAEASDFEAAKDAYRRGATSDNLFGRRCRAFFADMQRETGETDAARETYLRVLTSDDHTDRAIALVGLRELMRGAGDGPWSRETFERACAVYPPAAELDDYENWFD